MENVGFEIVDNRIGVDKKLEGRLKVLIRIVFSIGLIIVMSLQLSLVIEIKDSSLTTTCLEWCFSPDEIVAVPCQNTYTPYGGGLELTGTTIFYNHTRLFIPLHDHLVVVNDSAVFVPRDCNVPLHTWNTTVVSLSHCDDNCHKCVQIVQGVEKKTCGSLIIWWIVAMVAAGLTLLSEAIGLFIHHGIIPSSLTLVGILLDVLFLMLAINQTFWSADESCLRGCSTTASSYDDRQNTFSALTENRVYVVSLSIIFGLLDLVIEVMWLKPLNFAGSLLIMFLHV